MVFIESHAFTRRLRELAGDSADDVLREIQDDLSENPGRGDVVQGLGGIRKARAANPARAKGKRGGYRYLFMDKNEQADLDKEQRKTLRRMVSDLKRL